MRVSFLILPLLFTPCCRSSSFSMRMARRKTSSRPSPQRVEDPRITLSKASRGPQTRQSQLYSCPPSPPCLLQGAHGFVHSPPLSPPPQPINLNSGWPWRRLTKLSLSTNWLLLSALKNGEHIFTHDDEPCLLLLCFCAFVPLCALWLCASEFAAVAVCRATPVPSGRRKSPSATSFCRR